MFDLQSLLKKVRGGQKAEMVVRQALHEAVPNNMTVNAYNDFLWLADTFKKKKPANATSEWVGTTIDIRFPEDDSYMTLRLSGMDHVWLDVHSYIDAPVKQSLAYKFAMPLMGKQKDWAVNKNIKGKTFVSNDYKFVGKVK